MKKKMLLIVALCLLLTNVALAVRNADGLVTIQTDPRFLRLDLKTLNQIIYSPAVASRAVKTVLKVDMGINEVQEIVNFVNTKINVHDNTYPCHIQIVLTNNKELPPLAEELLKAVTESLKIAIDEAYLDFIKQKSKKVEALEANIQEAKDEWELVNVNYAGFINTNPIPHENIPEYISELTEDLEGELLDIETNRRFVKEAAKHRSEMEAKLKKQINDDPIIKQLSKLVEIETAGLKRIQQMKQDPMVIGAALEGAEKNLITAQIELAKRQEQLRQQSQSELADLSKRIVSTSIEIPLIEIRYSLLDKKLEKAKASLGYSHEYETLKLERRYARDNVEIAMAEQQRAKRDIDKFSPPTVVSIGIK